MKRDISKEAVLYSTTAARAHGKGPDTQLVLPQIQRGNDDHGTPILSKISLVPLRSGAQRPP